MNGWIKIHRGLLDWAWFGEADMVQTWMWMLMTANMADKEWKDIVIKRGQFATSISTISETLGIAPKRVRTILERLKRAGQIELNSTNKYTIITICNYDNYQTAESKEEQVESEFEGASKRASKIDSLSDYDSETCESVEMPEGQARGKQGASKRASKRASKNDSLIDCDSKTYEVEKTHEGQAEGQTEGQTNFKKKEERSPTPPKEEIKKITEEEEKKSLAKAKPKEKTADAVNADAKEILKEASDKLQKPAKPEFDLSFVEEEILPRFQDFLQMRKKIGKALKTQYGIQCRYNTLKRLSGDNAELAKQIIEQSLAHEWQDFYALKNEENNRKQQYAPRQQEYSNDKYW